MSQVMLNICLFESWKYSLLVLTPNSTDSQTLSLKNNQSFNFQIKSLLSIDVYLYVTHYVSFCIFFYILPQNNWTSAPDLKIDATQFLYQAQIMLHYWWSIKQTKAVYARFFLSKISMICDLQFGRGRERFLVQQV